MKLNYTKVGDYFLPNLLLKIKIIKELTNMDY